MISIFRDRRPTTTGGVRHFSRPLLCVGLALTGLATAAGGAVVWRARPHRAQTVVISHPRTTRSTSSTTTSTSTTTPGVEDVFDDPPVAAYLDDEEADGLEVTAAVYDAVTGRTWVYRPTVTLTTASVIKVDILEALLERAQVEGSTLTPTQQSLAASMIEDSTDDAASDLWATVGGAPAMGRYDNEIRLTQTRLNATGLWGLSTTSALDQVRVVEQLLLSSSPLTAASRTYELTLMRNVTPDQVWGVSSGVPAGATVALKNGWDPITGIWQVNSEGWIDGGGVNYVLSVMCWGAQTETSGIAAIDGLSTAISDALSSPR